MFRNEQKHVCVIGELSMTRSGRKTWYYGTVCMLKGQSMACELSGETVVALVDIGIAWRQSIFATSLLLCVDYTLYRPPNCSPAATTGPLEASSWLLEKYQTIFFTARCEMNLHM